MKIQTNIIKGLLNKDLWLNYNSSVDSNTLKENYPELFRIFNALKLLQEKEAKDYSIDDLELSFYANYPQAKREHYEPIFKELRSSKDSASKEAIEGYLRATKERESGLALARSLLKYNEGTIQKEEVQQLVDSFKGILERGLTLNEDKKEDFISDDLEILSAEQKINPGFRWRLPSLNRNLGPLRRGDLGLVFARPETGKTTFLASELTEMCYNSSRLGTKNPIIWFNNEERGSKIMARLYQGSLNVSLPVLYSNVLLHKQQYYKNTNGMIKIPDEIHITKEFVEKMCRIHKPAIIVFDQIDKIKGFTADRYDLEMKAIYQWARELAKQYGPVIGTCQAGGTAEGKKWLTMNDVDSSHTAKQGEVDWILGIGKTFEEGLEEVRYLHLCKNKLDGDADSDPTMRHGKWEVRIVPERARYEDF